MYRQYEERKLYMYNIYCTNQSTHIREQMVFTVIIFQNTRGNIFKKR